MLDVHEEGDYYARKIINKRLTKCLSRGGHYPFERQPMTYDHRTMLLTQHPPIPTNCARCGIGGPYRIHFDNAGRPMVAESL